MTQTAIKPEAAPADASRMKRLGGFLWRGLTGAALGGVLGWLLIESKFFGPAIGAVLGWYLARAIWGAVLGAGFGLFFIDGTSGTAAGMVVGAMIACNIVGRKGRWIVFAIVVVVVVVDVFSNERSRQWVLQWFGN